MVKRTAHDGFIGVRFPLGLYVKKELKIEKKNVLDFIFFERNIY